MLLRALFFSAALLSCSSALAAEMTVKNDDAANEQKVSTLKISETVSLNAVEAYACAFYTKDYQTKLKSAGFVAMDDVSETYDMAARGSVVKDLLVASEEQKASRVPALDTKRAEALVRNDVIYNRKFAREYYKAHVAHGRDQELALKCLNSANISEARRMATWFVNDVALYPSLKSIMLK